MEKMQQNNPADNEVLNKDFDSLDMSLKLQSYLVRMGVRTLNDIVTRDEDFFASSNIPNPQKRELSSMLLEHGLRYKDGIQPLVRSVDDEETPQTIRRRTRRQSN